MNLSIFKDIPFKRKTSCAVCGESLSAPVIKLPSLSLTDIYIKEKPREKVGFVDQNFHICKKCGHAQFSNIIDINILYGHTYVFRTSKSTWGATKGNDSLISFIDRITKGESFETIVEVGCNDLYLLNSLESRAKKLIGVDPTLRGREKEFSDDKITVIGDFFENTDLKEYIHSANTLIVSNHVIEHIEDPKSAIKKLLDISSDKTLFTFQFPGLDLLINDQRFDQIYHHHLHYFSLHSFMYLLNELGCELVGYDTNPHYWGSFLVAFRKTSKKGINPLSRAEKISPERISKSYDLFKKRMDVTGRYIESLKGERLFGYGAGLQLAVLGYHLNNDFSSFEAIIDDDNNKDNSFYINLPVPIKSSKGIGDLEDAIVVITAINFSRSILRKLIPLNPKRIILPFNNI